MNKGVMILWTVLMSVNLGLAIFIARWIIREFASEAKDAVRSVITWSRVGNNGELLALRYAILDGQRDCEASLKAYITEQLSEDKTLGSAIKVDGEMYVIVGVSKDVEVGEVASANIILRKVVE